MPKLHMPTFGALVIFVILAFLIYHFLIQKGK